MSDYPLTSACAPLRKRGRPARDDSAMPRAAILQKAFLAFAQQGYEHVSLRQLATDCGVSDSLLSHHFGSKQQLWYEATDSVFAPLIQYLLATLESNNSPNVADRLRHNLKSSLITMASRPEIMAFMFRESEGDNERAQHLRDHYLLPYIDRIHHLVDEARAQNLLRKLSHEACTGLVLGIMRMISLPGLYRPEITPHLASPERIEAYANEIVSILYDGVTQPVTHPVA